MLRPIKWITASAAVLALAAMTWRLGPDLAQVRISSPLFLIPAILAKAAVVIANALLYWRMAQVLELGVPWGASFRVITVSSALNGILPLGGNAAAALYLKSSRNLSISSFLSFLIATTLLSTCLCALSGGAAAGLLFMIHGGEKTLALAGIGLGLGALTLGLLAFPLQASRWQPGQRLMRGWIELRSRPKAALQISVICLFQLFCQFACLLCVYRSLGFHMGLLCAWTTSNFGLLSTALSLTPGSLGIYEATTTGVASLLDVPALLSFKALLIARAIYWGVIVVLGLFAARRLSEPELP